MWRDFFYFSFSDRVAITLLSVLLLAGITALWIWPDQTHQTISGEADTLLIHSSMKREKVSAIELTLKPFDPNTADSLTLRQMGIPQRVVRNLLRYREAGGKFRNSEDLSRIYGLDDSLFQQIAPYIAIATTQREPYPTKKAEKRRRNPSRENRRKSTASSDSIRNRTIYPVSEKYAEGTVLDLNKADTAELKKIPGIGSVYSRRVVSYRQQLGGFYRVEQLTEIEGLPEDIGRWFKIDSPIFRKIAINRSNIEMLRRHPYLNFYQARTIVEHRHQRGPLTTLQQLSLYEEFTATDL